MPGRDIQMLKVATFTADLPKQRRMRKKMFPQHMKKIIPKVFFISRTNYAWERGCKSAKEEHAQLIQGPVNNHIWL